MKKYMLVDLAQQNDNKELSTTANASYKYENEMLANALNDAELGLHRVSDIVQKMKIFDEMDSKQKSFCNINDCIEEVFASLKRRRQLPASTILVLAQVPNIYINSNHIKQVITHLLINASQAVSVDGKIIISSSFNNNCIQMSVADNGCGIPKQDLDKIFDLFYTTKKSNDGTGIGLAISFAFIAEHLGKLEVISEQGVGSTFTMSLPVSQKTLH